MWRHHIEAVLLRSSSAGAGAAAPGSPSVRGADLSAGLGALAPDDTFWAALRPLGIEPATAGGASWLQRAGRLLLWNGAHNATCGGKSRRTR